jgi:hypothetical protein
MSVSVYCFALNCSEFGARVGEPADEVLARVTATLSEADVSPDEQDETLEIVRELLGQGLRRLSSTEDLHAACWLLESEAEKIPLYTLQGWAARAFGWLGLEQLGSSNEPAYFGSITLPEPNRLQYLAAADLSERVIPSLRHSLQQQGSIGLGTPADDEVADAYQELLEVFESVEGDGMDVILVTLED